MRLADTADVQLLNLPEKAGNIAFYLSVLAILGGYAWWSRRRYARTDDPHWVIEASGVMLVQFDPSSLTLNEPTEPSSSDTEP